MNDIKQPNQYTLRFLTDLLGVPDERLDDCLDTMKQMIRSMRLVATAAVAEHEEANQFTMTDEQKQEFIRFSFPSMIWIDDGTTINTITNNGEPMLTVQTVLPEESEKMHIDQPLVLYGDHIGDIQEWIRRQPELADVDPFIFEDNFKGVMGSHYNGCWSQIPDFYSVIICKTHDSLKSMPPEFKLGRIGRSVRTSNKGQLIKTDITHDAYMLIY